MSYSKISRINDSSNIPALVITINDIELKADTILDAEIVWKDDFNITGYVIFNEMYNITTQANIKAGSSILWYQADMYDEFYSREFIITNVKEVKDKNNKTIELEFQDKVSWTLANTFESKNYSGKRVSDIIKDVNIPNIVYGFPINIDIENTDIKTSLIVPGNVSLLSFIQEELNKEGFILYQDKKNIKLVNTQNLMPSELPTNKFIYKEISDNSLYGFMIMDYHINHNNIEKTNTVKNQTVLIYDPRTKQMVQENSSLSDIYSEIKTTNNVTDNSQLTTGSQYTTQEYLGVNNLFKELYMTYLENTSLSIAVPGNIMYNKRFQITDIILMGNPNIQEEIDTGDIKLSGKYICTQIVDKILPGQKFIQKLIINRIDYDK